MSVGRTSYTLRVWAAIPNAQRVRTKTKTARHRVPRRLLKLQANPLASVVHASHSAHAATGHCGHLRFLFRQFGNHGFGGHKQTGN